MVAPIRYGCPQSVMVALVDYFLRDALIDDTPYLIGFLQNKILIFLTHGFIFSVIH